MTTTPKVSLRLTKNAVKALRLRTGIQTGTSQGGPPSCNRTYLPR